MPEIVDRAPDQIRLIDAIAKALGKQGFDAGTTRQFNAIVQAATLVVDAFSRHDTPSVPGSGLAAWLASDETGASSLEMARHLAPRAGLQDYVKVIRFDPATPGYPRDPADLGRCVGLLDAVPSLRPHLPRMAELSPKWAALVAAWEELEGLYREELPSGNAPKCHDRMKAILEAKDGD